MFPIRRDIQVLKHEDGFLVVEEIGKIGRWQRGVVLIGKSWIERMIQYAKWAIEDWLKE